MKKHRRGQRRLRRTRWNALAKIGRDTDANNTTQTVRGRRCYRCRIWADESNASKLPEVARPQMGNVKRVFGVVGDKVTKYQAGKELVPGITAVASPGHTPGHTSHVVASGNSKILVQADITAGAASIFARNPDWQFVFDTDKPLAVQTRRKLYDMAASEKMMVQGYHLAFPSMTYVEKNGNGYRLVPVPWSSSI
jgi:glyoxylase-like metal-dependent hydrolase (beta-lactamase superfamily II)